MRSHWTVVLSLAWSAWAAPAWAQGTYVSASLTGDFVRLTHSETDGMRGLRAGGELKHHGIAVGRVESVALNGSGSSIDVVVRLTPQGEIVARRGSRFWIVRPQVDLGGVRGLETVIGDKQLAVEPGPIDGPAASRFVGLEEPPLPDAGIEGGFDLGQAAAKDGEGGGRVIRDP